MCFNLLLCNISARTMQILIFKHEKEKKKRPAISKDFLISLIEKNNDYAEQLINKKICIIKLI